MASRVKRMFHRKREDDDESHNDQPDSHPSGSEPALRTSRYDTTVAAGAPQTGDYPIKGNDSSVALTQQGRKSSVRSRRSSGSQNRLSRRSVTPDHYVGHRNNMVNPRPPSDIVNPDIHSLNYAGGPRREHHPRRLSQSQLPQDFANMNIGNTGPTTVTQTVTTTHFSPNSTGRRDPTQNSGPVPTANQSIRPVNDGILPKPLKTYTKKQSPTDSPSYQSHVSPDGSADVNDNVRRQHQAIPRKQIGAKFNETPQPQSGLEASPRYRMEDGQRHGAYNSSSPPKVAGSTAFSPPPDTSAQHMTKPLRPRKNSRGDVNTGPAASAQAVVDRAKSKTVETHVTESVAPAITHETVHSNVHHIREEVITREVHEHDVYHRMLPIIDVEVLPPRHFLPVEGGGLVEIGAKEVPGRGNHWVIAETASKIPSDQVASTGRRAFSARQFAGREGDSRKYTTPDGHEKTEQTWVHPPELETGGRDTGQTWPMYFGDNASIKTRGVQASPKSTKKRSTHKGSR